MLKEKWPVLMLALIMVLTGGVYVFRNDAGFSVEIEDAEGEIASSAFSVEETQETAAPAPGPVNINTAGAEELDSLPGIGPAKAAAILADRAERGLFCAIEEIMRVPGIKEGIFGEIRGLITVGEAPEALRLREQLDLKADAPPEYCYARFLGRLSAYCGARFRERLPGKRHEGP